MRRNDDNRVGRPVATLFKAGPGWCTAVFNKDRDLISFSLPAPRSYGHGIIAGLSLEPYPALEEAVQKYFRGERVDFSGFSTPLPDTPPFYREVYRALRTVGWGQSVTYGQLAVMAGAPPGAARAAGGAMRNNPVPLIIPCHRVLASNGPGGFSAQAGLSLKKRMLELEGMKV